MTALRLGVNLDHVATLRNARGADYPDPIRAAHLAIEAGADGITLHLREDRRHIRDDDIRRARALPIPLNMEMAATDEMVGIACGLRPHACCLVPERRAEITTEGGLDVAGNAGSLGPAIARLREAGIRVSLFVDPEPPQLEAAAALGAPVVELHTGAYAEQKPGELERLVEGARLGASLGLEVHAGHGLSFTNVGPVAAIPELRELNIGHFLVGEAVFIGLAESIRRMRALMDAARRHIA
ncbi:pyridoxine 5'-phosphate synthase [Acidiphilium sp. AL]|uniref:Pyridoxine 5'-phosphate synthase n=1 Tax=Acidiphilium iwatense TaxID=768198 RepID=A0ABS9DYG1_9PROT|nr:MULTISPECIES: pyridoxine 5'-phosphate synthase [Acidiphilium]MCF3946840.1 pyridoxine 5'-phosphate synthase [Acidiphilium iwatense]MCU4161024.1 pyridoxine 5'-phosphate synthase [Acidiphilium sp. AL]